MGCFSSKEEDQYKADLRTATLLSLSGDEDRQARQEIEGKKAEINLSEKKQEKEEIRSEKPKEKGKRKQENDDDQEDKQLPKANKETFKDEGHSKDDMKVAANPPPPSCSISDRGKSDIEGGKSVNPQGLCCPVCHEPFDVDEIPKKEKYHKHCYEHRSICYVCKGKIPLNEKRERECNWHPFWKKNYCPVHDNDGTPKCCSCERLKPQGATYVTFEDGRKLCLECMESALMDSDECQHLQFDVREFFEGLHMKIEKQFHFLLVEQQALNKAAEKEEKLDQRYEEITRGICLSEEQTVNSVSKKPTMGPNSKLIDMATESVWVDRKCEVTGILILYGLPRLLTGHILAHEMMHAYLRLNGHMNLNNVLEEGLCQVLGHMWLDSEKYATAADATATVDASSSSASSSSRPPAASASKKGAHSDIEKKLVDFYKDQIETDKTKVYGRGFRIVNEMVTNSSLPETLKAIIRSRKTIPDSEL